jgi:hypothetical protein
MRPLCFVLAFGFALPAFAQKELFFGLPGSKPPIFKEQDIDRRFKKSRLGKALYTGAGAEDPACIQLLGGLLTALAEATPYFHLRDENFTLDPILLEAIQQQLSTPSFPAAAYLMAMIRRVLIEKKVPDEWLELATTINPVVHIIDVGKLRAANERMTPIDSFLFSLPALRERYIVEVVEANSAVTTDVESSFHDSYVDRQVAWGGALLIDAGVNKKPKKGKKFDPNNTMEEIIAILQWLPPDPNEKEVNLLRKKIDTPPPIKIFARLAPKQYLDLERLPRGKRLIVKGRFWQMTKDMSEVEVKDAVLFEDRDWSRGVILGDPNAIAECPMAINELTGLAPVQPGGFKH